MPAGLLVFIILSSTGVLAGAKIPPEVNPAAAVEVLDDIEIGLHRDCVFCPDDAGSDCFAVANYLATMSDNGYWSPFTQNEQAIFDRSASCDRWATWTLYAFFVPAVIFGSGGSLLSFVSEPIGHTTEQMLVSVTPAWAFGIGFVIGVAGGTLSYLATGWFPHKASEKANIAQNKRSLLVLKFRAIAGALKHYMLNGDPNEKARALSLIKQFDPAVVARLERLIEERMQIEDSKFIMNPIVVLYKAVALGLYHYPDYHGLADGIGQKDDDNLGSDA